ncbi:MAG: Gfo/Idh/MocA family oxidoreductase [Clostridiales bacterium]|nr:Gfo/Idh/MocA family oxidoreductase [Clostridiales bacterium]
MDKIRVAIVGAGNIARTAHMPAYRKRTDVEIVGVADINYERAQNFAESFGVPKAFPSIEAMLDEVECDYVDICVWNGSHASCAIEAAKRGRAVLCEKPMALNLEHALKMKEAIQAAGVPFMLAVPTRYSSQAMLLREMVDAGKLGDIYYAKTAYTRRRGTPIGWFTDTRKSGGGPVIDIGVHCIDRTWFLMGCPKPVRVSASTSYAIGEFKTRGVHRWAALDSDVTAFDTEDSACGVIHFENGAAMMFEVSWALNAPGESFTQICGSKGGARLDPLTIYGEDMGYLTDNKPNPGENDMFYEEIDHFIHCLRTGETPRSDLEQAVTMQRILQGIYDSARLKKEVEI